MEKDVGVYISKNLKPSEHGKIAATKATTVLNQILKSFHYGDKKVNVGLYKKYIRSHPPGICSPSLVTMGIRRHFTYRESARESAALSIQFERHNLPGKMLNALLWRHQQKGEIPRT